jgi:hypothetical protein
VKVDVVLDGVLAGLPLLDLPNVMLIFRVRIWLLIFDLTTKELFVEILAIVQRGHISIELGRDRVSVTVKLGEIPDVGDSSIL